MQTPMLFIDREKIKNNYREIKNAFPQINIAYAIKSNSHQEIIKILQKENSFFETASISEIEYLISLGIEPSRILFSNPVKAISAIERALQLGIKKMTFDSLEEAEKIIHLKNYLHLFLRLIVSNEGSQWPLVGKFGLGRALWEDAFTLLKEKSIPLKGISFHVGSQCESLTAWDNAMNTAYDAFVMAKNFGLQPSALNIGGGFPIFLGADVPSAKEISQTITKHLERWQQDGIILQEIFAEPGRFISGSAGFIQTKVLGIAQRDLNGTRKKWVYLDAGVFGGLMETIDGITYPILTDGEGELERVQLCGPSCDSVDKMFEVSLPSPKEGDTIYLLGAGAYTTVYASNFNGFAMPQIEFIDSTEEFFKKLPQPPR